jgi:GNAT superfamily N-acetyltransferase
VVPEPVSSPFSQTDIVARRVGPRQAQATPGERITGLAADNHFAAALLTLWHRVSQSGGAVGFEASASRSEVASAVTEAINAIRAGSRHAVVLTAGNELIAVAFLVLEPLRIRRHLGDVRSLMVDPGYQGLGLERRLVDEIAVLATDVGVSTLLVGARAGQGLDRFYQGLGFEEYGRLPDSVRLSDGSSYDEILYRRAATPPLPA